MQNAEASPREPFLGAHAPRMDGTRRLFSGRSDPPGPYGARGAALLVCIFAMVIVSSLVVLALDVQATEMSITRNTLSMSKALYTADAGVQHALGMLRTERTWRSGFPNPIGLRIWNVATRFLRLMYFVN